MQFKEAIASERTALIFLLKLLILLCVVKTIFFIYNYQNNLGWEINSSREALRIFSWAIYYDLVCVAFCALPFLLMTLLPIKNRVLLSVAAACSISLIVLTLILNIADIFYFPFHRQRADADLFYVLRNPFKNSGAVVWWILAVTVVFAILSATYFWKQYRLQMKAQQNAGPFLFSSLICCVVVASLFIGQSKKIIPTRPLTDVSSLQLPLTQNSLHSFLYSVYRSRESVIPQQQYMTSAEQADLFSPYKSNVRVANLPKNIVLFIMESVPYEFFDSSSKYKPLLPFLDSLKNHATYYNNAFSYSYSSNKGITAMLTGLPTITDIPLYHSSFANINKTDIGKLLEKRNYRSSFFIGDNYDDFGFAKCCNWTGIQHYYCMQDVPGYKKMEKHTMGLQDEYVLDFMQQQLQKTAQPFFATQYNISTHYPNDLTAAFALQTRNLSLPPAMKSMMYYDACLQSFFKQASIQPWYQNTVFLFCSDHWARPDPDHTTDDMVNSFRIPILVFEPGSNERRTVTNLVSQFDIMNTVLAYAGIKDSITSYGTSLLDATDTNRIVFTKVNTAVYQAIDKNYVLGFNAEEGKALYCYEYKTDTARRSNLIKINNPSTALLDKTLKAFLQTASHQYLHKN